MRRLTEKNEKAILLPHDLPNYYPISGGYAGEVESRRQLREIERNRRPLLLKEGVGGGFIESNRCLRVKVRKSAAHFPYAISDLNCTVRRSLRHGVGNG